LTGIFLVRYIHPVDTLTLNALGEPSRLRIVELLRERPCSVGEISDRLRLRQPQVSKHLRVLSNAGIVGVRPVAQRRVYQLQREPFAELETWLNTFRPTWEERLDTLEEYLRGLRASQPRSEKGKSRSEGMPDR
jgi:DNA-binding transcriptional ArsR family regulator